MHHHHHQHNLHNHHHHHHHRRRKKRPNYGTRTVEICRGFNGFGFTISGQKPCILSCIVSNSPAEQAGLRAGDFLISVNGLNVSKLPHESVVQLIGNSTRGTIKMEIAENYFSDSSDEDNLVAATRVRPRYLHHKMKMNRLRNSPQKIGTACGIAAQQQLISASDLMFNLNDENGEIQEQIPKTSISISVASSTTSSASLRRPIMEIENISSKIMYDGNKKTGRFQSSGNSEHSGFGTGAHNIIHSPNASTSHDISNVSAMVRKGGNNKGLSNGITVRVSSLSTSLNGDLSMNAADTTSTSMAVLPASPMSIKSSSSTLSTSSSSSSTPVSASTSYPLPVEMLNNIATVPPVGIVAPNVASAGSLEYRAIVGYLGTIEMPKQIATSSKLQTVRSCIRKMRQEKRNPTIVLMTILPNCLTLRSSNSTILASYPSSRLNYVSSSSENENRFFGLVTNAIYSSNDDDADDDNNDEDQLSMMARDHNQERQDQQHNLNSGEVIISNSCHVFVIDTKICEHAAHEKRAQEFNIICTKDPISNLCLEFPNNSEYVVNLIRSMYTMKVLPPPGIAASRNSSNHNVQRFQQRYDILQRNHAIQNPINGGGIGFGLQANSPQPSNHSEITTSSNSDSGIGFHNDCANISDRIVVVDFPAVILNHQQRDQEPQHVHHHLVNNNNNRPHAICNLDEESAENIDNSYAISTKEFPKNDPSTSNNNKENHPSSPPSSSSSLPSNNSKGFPLTDDLKNNRLTVRAMPDPKIVAASQKQTSSTSSNIPDLLTSFSCMNGMNFSLPSTSGNLTATRSCDDVISSVENNSLITREKKKQIQIQSMDDIIMINDKNFSHHINSNCYKKQKNNDNKCNKTDDDYVFLQPLRPGIRKIRKSLGFYSSKNQHDNENKCPGRSENDLNKLISYKLSPKVFNLPKPNSISYDNLTSIQALSKDTGKNELNESKKLQHDSNYELNNKIDRKLSIDSFEIWGSLQNLSKTKIDQEIMIIDNEHYGSNFMEGAYSEPDLTMSRALPSSSSSPFRRWGNSSFRTPKSTESRPPLVRRPSSLVASENDVYTKSMDEFMNELNKNSSNLKTSVKKNICKTIRGRNDGSEEILGDSCSSSSSSSSAASSSASLTSGKVTKRGLISISTPSIQNSNNHNNNNNSNNNNKQQRKQNTHSVSEWGNSFEKLLEDPAGLETFAEFLKKEFSAENIYFWTACQRYRQLESDEKRAKVGMEIYAKHLAPGALEPVNVDSQARNVTEESLHAADKDIFNHAQKQIFNLMKFDSYQRFIRSDLYKKCLDAAAKNQQLPFSGENLDELLMTTMTPNSNLSPNVSSKLKKSASNAEDRRRKSLLPWHRKTRSKSRDRDDDSDKNTETNNTGNLNKFVSKLQLPRSGGNKTEDNTFGGGNSTIKQHLTAAMTNSTSSDLHSSKSSLSSFDAAINSAIVAAAVAAGRTSPGGLLAEETKFCPLCRVILCDGATTVAQTRPNETIRQLIDRLLEKRGINYKNFDVFLTGNNKPIDQENISTVLAGQEVQIEQRVQFKLDLPDPKVISVKSKPKKTLYDVLSQILQKYNYRLEDMIVLIRETQEQIDVNVPVTIADGQRLQVITATQENRAKVMNTDYQNNCISKNIPIFSSKSNSKSSIPQTKLDEITNKVFNELLQGKVEAHANQGMLQSKSAEDGGDQCSLKSEDYKSESSSIFDRFRGRDSGIPILRPFKPKKPPVNSSNRSDNSLQGGITEEIKETGTTANGVKKPLIAKWKTGVKIQVTGRAENHDEFLEGLKRAQRARLEDQRGTEINSELPDFLKGSDVGDKENISAASKLRKIRANLTPITSSAASSNNINITTSQNCAVSEQQQYNTSGYENDNNNFISVPPVRKHFVETPLHNLNIVSSTSSSSLLEKPQPAPRLSLTKSTTSLNTSSGMNSSTINNTTTSISSGSNTSFLTTSGNSNEETDPSNKGPPPLPPKPKVLPIKPSNWGQNNSVMLLSIPNNSTVNNNSTIINNNSNTLSGNNPNIINNNSNNNNNNNKNLMGVAALDANNVYLDQPSSSFV